VINKETKISRNDKLLPLKLKFDMINTIREQEQISSHSNPLEKKRRPRFSFSPKPNVQPLFVNG
jgi:hypothetical protein